MNQRIFVLSIVGLLCITFSFTLLPPLVVSYWYQDGELPDFEKTFFTLIIIGMLLWAFSRRRIGILRRRDGLLIVAPCHWCLVRTT
jgi:trk system potassium uptake protein TrkH